MHVGRLLAFSDTPLNFRFCTVPQSIFSIEQMTDYHSMARDQRRGRRLRITRGTISLIKCLVGKFWNDVRCSGSV